MNSLKTLCVAIVLSAVAYGAYVTLTGRANAPPPPDAGDWASAPQVQLPELSQTAMASSSPSSTPSVRLPPTTPEPAPQYLTPSSTSSTESTPAETPAAVLSTDPTSMSTPPTSIATIGTSIDSAPVAMSDGHAEFAAAWSQAQTMLDQGNLAEALLLLSDWVTNSHLSPVDREQLFDLLDRLAGTVVYSKQHLLEPPYVVQPGDTLEKIADRYSIPWPLLQKINGLPDAQAIRPGDQLKVLHGPFDALVSLQDFEMTLFLYGRYAGRFRIGVGQDQSTPDGEMTVQNKVLNPTYYGPGQVIGPDDPTNPLGGRWIDLGNKIGIHGTNDPASIGRAESRGCIRLSPADISDVYDILSVGSRVTICAKGP